MTTNNVDTQRARELGDKLNNWFGDGVVATGGEVREAADELRDLAAEVDRLRAERALLEQVVSMARYTCFAMEWDGRADLDLPRALAALDAQREAHRE